MGYLLIWILCDGGRACMLMLMLMRVKPTEGRKLLALQSTVEKNNVARQYGTHLPARGFSYIHG